MPLNRANLAVVRLPDHVSRSRLRLVQGKPMKREPNEKECRALMVSRHRHNSASSSSISSISRVVHLVQSIRARVVASRKVGKEGNQDKRHRPGSNKFGGGVSQKRPTKFATIIRRSGRRSMLRL